MEKITRDSLLEEVLSIDSKALCLQLATGVGKSRLCLEWIDKYNPQSVLVVVPKLVLIDNFKQECIKWNKINLLAHITFTTYISLPKYSYDKFDAVIIDECHHLTERSREGLETIKFNHILFMSGTIPYKVAHYISTKYHPIWKNLDTKEAIDNEILPEPTVLLLPLHLKNSTPNQIYIKRKSCKKVVNCTYTNRWQFLKDKSAQVHINCTERQYYNLLENDIESATNHGRDTWKQQLTISRLKWLSDIKTPIIKDLLSILRNYKTLTFCSSMEQCEEVGKYPIHSGKKELLENLELFNNNKIKHITACAILNEGCNLTECRIGIFAHIQSSTIATVQKIGRILRHSKPIIILPYYVGTREEEIVEKMKLNFNPDSLIKINFINEITMYLK